MMDLLKAYARQVVSYHPPKQRDELFDEIYDSLCEEYSDRQAGDAGLSEADFLNRYKRHPMRYATDLAADGSAYLVGPRFYFSFLSALKIAAAMVVVFHVVIGAVGVFGGGGVWSSFLGSFVSLPVTLLWVGAMVLGVFVALEKSGERASWLDEWDAADLKRVDSHQAVSNAEALFDFSLASVLLLWLLDIIHLPSLIRHDGVWVSEWTVNLPGWFWLAAGLLLVFDIVFALDRLRRAFWTNRMRLVKIVTQLAWIGLLAFAASQAGLLSAEHEAVSEFTPLIEKGARAGLLVVCTIIAWDTLVHAWRLAKGLRY